MLWPSVTTSMTVNHFPTTPTTCGYPRSNFCISPSWNVWPHAWPWSSKLQVKWSSKWRNLLLLCPVVRTPTTNRWRWPVKKKPQKEKKERNQTYRYGVVGFFPLFWPCPLAGGGSSLWVVVFSGQERKNKNLKNWAAKLCHFEFLIFVKKKNHPLLMAGSVHVSRVSFSCNTNSHTGTVIAISRQRSDGWKRWALILQQNPIRKNSAKRSLSARRVLHWSSLTPPPETNWLPSWQCLCYTHRYIYIYTVYIFGELLNGERGRQNFMLCSKK